ncbi:hypothetical protein BDY19DRAFT_612346 [Irpex rosettiformis]|uniref:Uncharacterized protein n=1 Tax=Irpex rosettiformis TaxID=378272 RepID=A0ACB8TP52_9APHY|nr:hypothetical protein BDY19DRAFT_612346 [Irpex rosettiformis]
MFINDKHSSSGSSLSFQLLHRHHIEQSSRTISHRLPHPFLFSAPPTTAHSPIFKPSYTLPLIDDSSDAIDYRLTNIMHTSFPERNSAYYMNCERSNHRYATHPRLDTHSKSVSHSDRWEHHDDAVRFSSHVRCKEKGRMLKTRPFGGQSVY